MQENNLQIIFRPEVEEDLLDIYIWYEDKSSGLGEEFLRLFYTQANEVSRRPNSYLKKDDFRRSLMRRFPYSIYFVLEDKTVLVLGVFHTSRDPEFVRSALENRNN